MVVDATILLERAEMAAFADLFAAASPEIVADAGLSVQDVGGASLIATTRFDVLALNRVIGLGVDQPASESVLAEVLSTVDHIGSARFLIPIAPIDRNRDLGIRLEQHGAHHYNNWMRLWRNLGDLPIVQPAGIEVRQIDQAESRPFGDMVATEFRYPAAVAPLPIQSVGRSHWCHYCAYDRDIPIATAAMYVAGDAAWFGFAATDSNYRGRGAQTALLVRQLVDARAAGCRLVSAETTEDTVLQNAPSFRNLQRLGFEIAYRRPNYLWRRPTPDSAA